MLCGQEFLVWILRVVNLRDAQATRDPSIQNSYPLKRVATQILTPSSSSTRSRGCGCGNAHPSESALLVRRRRSRSCSSWTKETTEYPLHRSPASGEGGRVVERCSRRAGSASGSGPRNRLSQRRLLERLVFPKDRLQIRQAPKLTYFGGELRGELRGELVATISPCSPIVARSRVVSMVRPAQAAALPIMNKRARQ